VTVTSRRQTSLSTPLSTKLVVFLGVALVVVGFAIAGWQQLSPDKDQADSIPAPAQSAQQYLPDIRTVVVYLAVLLCAVLGGAYVFVRSRRRHTRP
jgi:DMSO reductase anchor subunit